MNGVIEVGFPNIERGTTGTIVCPVTEKEERGTVTDIELMLTLYTPFGYHHFDIKCSGCNQTHRVFNPRFSGKKGETLRR